MPGRSPRGGKARDLLTERQQEVLQLIADGRSNSEIAELLDLSLDSMKSVVRDILDKLDVTSREGAVAIWQQESRPGIFSKRRALALLIAAVVVVGSVSIWAFLQGGGDTGSGDAMHVRIAFPRTPLPGLKVIELPSEREVLLIEDLNEIQAPIWSPDGTALVVCVGETRQLAFIDYATGAYDLVGECLRFQSLRADWSPDSTRLLVAGDELRMYTAKGDLLAEQTEATLGFDPEFIYPSPSLWAANSTVLVVGQLRGAILDRDGAIAGRFEAGSLPEFVAFSSPSWRWVSEPADGLFGRGLDQRSFADANVTSSGQGSFGGPGIDWSLLEFVYLKLEAAESGYQVKLSTAAEYRDIFRFVSGTRPPPDILDEIEQRRPADLRALYEARIGVWGWAAAFEPVQSGPDEPRRFSAILQVGDIVYEYEYPDRMFGFNQAFDDRHIVVLNGTEPAPAPLSEVAVSACPIWIEYCQLAVYTITLLEDADVAALIELSTPTFFWCHGRPPPEFETEPCRQSVSELSRYRFEVKDGDDHGAWLTSFDFSIMLGEISGRMRHALPSASDQLGDGRPRVLGFTCPGGGPTAECDPESFTVTWIERGTGGSTPRRVGATFLVAGSISGIDVLETESEVLAALADPADRQDDSLWRVVLWSPEDQ